MNRIPIQILIADIKSIAATYKRETGNPLGVTGEIGELQCAEMFGIELAPVRTKGYDGTLPDGRRVQIKSRAVFDASNRWSQRTGYVSHLDHWELLYVVIMDDDYSVKEVYSIDQQTYASAVKNKNRTDLSISQVKKIGTKIH